MNTRTKLTLNTGISLLYEVVEIVCGFVLPRAILSGFGSEVNGLVNSVAEFLGVIMLLDLGVGQVVQSSLYKPLTVGDKDGVSGIYRSGRRFFGRIALIMLAYTVILSLTYPLIRLDEFDYLFTLTLILAMSISTFGQHYFGVVDTQLLLADQRGFIQYSARTVTLIISTVVCVILIKVGASIQLVKLSSSLIFLLRPLALSIYVKRHYRIDRKIKYEGEPIKQKWNGFAQHLASFILGGTDSIVLTVFTNYLLVSVYSVYHMVYKGINKLFLSMTNGVNSLLGELWAKKDIAAYGKVFSRFEWLTNVCVTFFYGCAGLLIVAFVQVYTVGVGDAQMYNQPLFAALLTAANALIGVRLPYVVAVFATGEYKRTQVCFISAALINVVVSVATVLFWGLIGVAIGTLCAMTYQTVWLAVFNSKYLDKGKLKNFFKLFFTDALTVALMFAATLWIKLEEVTFLGWTLMALKVSALSAAIVVLVNLVFCFNNVKEFIQTLKNRNNRPIGGDKG